MAGKARALSAAELIAGCDRLSTPPRRTRPLAALASAATHVEPSIKLTMPEVAGLARDPLDSVAYANPLGYLPEIRALIAKGADAWGLMRWTQSMETIALYAAARVFAAATTAPVHETVRSVTVDDEDARLVAGDLEATQITNHGALVVLGDLRVRGVYFGSGDLVVLGNAAIGFVDADGGMAVRRGLSASRAIYLASHDSTAYVGGTVRSPLVVLDDKSLRAAKISAKLVLDSRSCDASTAAKARRLLTPSLVKPTQEDDADDFPVDLDALCRRARTSKPLLKN